MTTTFKEGDHVQISDRNATAEDVKSNLFFNHFRGLVGVVQKIYATDEAAIEIDTERLPEAVAIRHHDVQETMKNRWLDGLSEEGRNRLTPQEKDFRLRYTVLVALRDIHAPTTATAPQEATARATEADLAAAEEAELQRRQQTKTG